MRRSTTIPVCGMHRTIVKISSSLYVVDMSDINAFYTGYPRNKGYEDNSLLGPLLSRYKRDIGTEYNRWFIFMGFLVLALPN